MITNLLAILTSAAEEGTLGELTARPHARRRVPGEPRHDRRRRPRHRRQRPARIRNHQSPTIRPRPPNMYEMGPISIYLAVAKAKVGTRRRGAAGSGAAVRTREAAAVEDEAARARTAARREREAAPRHAIA